MAAMSSTHASLSALPSAAMPPYRKTLPVLPIRCISAYERGGGVGPLHSGLRTDLSDAWPVISITYQSSSVMGVASALTATPEKTTMCLPAAAAAAPLRGVGSGPSITGSIHAAVDVLVMSVTAISIISSPSLSPPKTYRSLSTRKMPAELRPMMGAGSEDSPPSSSAGAAGAGAAAAASSPSAGAGAASPSAGAAASSPSAGAAGAAAGAAAASAAGASAASSPSAAGLLRRTYGACSLTTVHDQPSSPFFRKARSALSAPALSPVPPKTIMRSFLFSAACSVRSSSASPPTAGLDQRQSPGPVAQTAMPDLSPP